MLYHDLIAEGIPVDSHESDLYCPVTPRTAELLARHNITTATVFRHQQTQEWWYDVPFAYLPWWERRSQA